MPCRWARRVCLGLLLPGLCLAGLEPTARDPLVPPLFSIDRDSPTIGLGFKAADILKAPGPAVQIAARNLALFDEADDLDGLSVDNAGVGFDELFVLILSVDRDTLGAVPPDPLLVALGLPFNVQEQAGKNQAAGDAYMSLLLYTRSGPIPPGPLSGSHSQNNSLVINQGDAGGVDFSLLPDISPRDSNPPLPDPLDNLDAAALTDLPDQQPTFVFFSLTRDSPSLPSLPGATPSGADIFLDSDTSAPGGEFLYVPPFELGLQPPDDIDALLIFDDGDLVFTPGVDQIVFSLTPDSPSLGGTLSAADLLTSFGGGLFDVYSQAVDYGLDLTDNLSAVDLVPCDDVLSCAFDWAIGYPIEPGESGGVLGPSEVRAPPPR